MAVQAKICGLSDEESVDAAVTGGAALVGFVFFPPSPRALSPARAAELAARVPVGIRKVGLFVDPDDDLLDDVLAVVPLDMIQLHGKETPDRVAKIRARYKLPVMKALAVAGPKDLAAAAAYAPVADMLLFDARPPKGADRPGGNARSFDWTILQGADIGLPWMLAGGLDASNVAEAVRISGATAVDVSSGVETAPGRKDPAAIKAFLDVVRTL
jgi:phosphoribosylanthranilate isomerase